MDAKGPIPTDDPPRVTTRAELNAATRAGHRVIVARLPLEGPGKEAVHLPSGLVLVCEGGFGLGEAEAMKMARNESAARRRGPRSSDDADVL